MNKLALLIFTSLTLLLFACKNGNETPAPTTNDTLRLKALDEKTIEALNDSISPEVALVDTTDEKKIFGRGKLWKVWKKLHRDCQNSEITKGMLYFGVSNTLGVGTIVEFKDKKYIPDFPILPEKFNEEQKKLVFNNGSSVNCQFTQNMKVNTEFMVQSSMTSVGNGELSGLIGNARSINANIESWQQNILYPSGLNSVLKSDSNSYFKSYLEVAKKPGRYIVNKEILINGFSATITTSTNISADLKLALERGIVENLGDTNAKVKFSYVNETTIKITTVGSFVVFVELYKLES